MVEVGRAMRRIHVTGGNGYIGRGIVAGLGHDPRFSLSWSDVGDVDVLDAASLRACFDREKPDVVIHLAGMMGARLSTTELRRCFAINSVGVLNALDAALNAGVSGFVFMSSLTVYGQNDGATPVTEATPFRPRHVYGSSKAAAEYFVRDYARFARLNSVVLRPTIIPGNLAGEPNAINEFCTNVVRDEPIVIFGRGSHSREWLSLADLVRAVEKTLLFMEGKQGVNEDFIVSSGKGLTMMDLAHTCVRILGKGRIETVDRETSQAFSLTSDITKARTVLGWHPEDGVETIIRDVARAIETRQA